MASQFKSTYARLFVGFSPDISQLMVKYARKTGRDTAAVLPITILSSNQVTQSSADPHNASLVSLISAFKETIRADHQFLEGSDDAIKQKATVKYILDDLAQKRPKATPAAQSNIDNITHSIEEQWRLIQNIENAMTHHAKQVNEVKAKFKSVAEKNDKIWTQFKEAKLVQLQHVVDKVIDDARLQSLPPGEIENLIRLDSWQDMLDRYYDLGANRDPEAAAIEKLIGLKSPTIDSYYKLKAYLAIRSVNPSHENMPQYLKKLGPFFDATKHEADEMTTQQIAEIKNMEENLQPAIKITQKNNETLSRLDKDREVLMQGIASIDEIEQIKQKATQSLEGPAPSRDFHGI